MDAITNQLFRGSKARSFQPFQSLRPDVGSSVKRHERAEEASRPQRGAEPKKAATDVQAAMAMSYRRSEGTSLFIKTQEGDLVKLKISSRESLSMAATLTQSDEGTVSSMTQQASSRMRVSFEVEGDLNEDELAAISSVVEQAGALADKFFNDDVAGAFALAQSLQVDASQLANVGLRMSLREEMTYTAKGLPQAANLTPPADASAKGAPEAAAPQTPPPATPVPTAPLDIPEAEAAADDARTVAAPPVATQTPAPRAPDVIRRFLTQLLDTLSAPPANKGADAATSMDLSLKLRIFQSVVTSAAETKAMQDGTEPALSPLVPETLDALAAREEAPLKAVA